MYKIFYVLLVLFIPLISTAQTYTMATTNTTTCSGTFYDSGNSGSNYSNSENFTYVFCPSMAGGMVQLNFSAFDLETNYDFLKIYDGGSAAAPLIGNYTSTNNPGIVTSTTGCLTIVFTSDGSVTRPGWTASVSCISPSAIIMADGNTTNCSVDFYDSGNIGGSYSNSENFTHTFCPVTVTDMVQLNFTVFNLENNYDFLKIYDGSSAAAPLIGSYTGTTLPGLITSTTGCLTVVFTSDGSITSSGWAAAVSCVAPPGLTMTNGSVSRCGGDFYDSGNISGNYTNNENYVYTICPTTAGQSVLANFINFDLENNYDFLEIYDGNSTSATSLGLFTGTTSPGIIQASPSNPTGCLTFRFHSDGSAVRPGWEVALSCLSACQVIASNISSTPTASSGVISVCLGQSISFVGSGTFSAGNSAGATYNWTMDNGTSLTGTNISYTYPNSGIYFVNLNITDANGCTNNNILNQEVHVMSVPIMNTSVANNPLCVGTSTTLTTLVTPVPVNTNCAVPVSDTTFLPDGNGVSYTTAIPVNCFDPTETITAGTDIQNICINMEHSYLGDLHIRIICPNGQSSILKSYPGGSSTYLGSPIDNGSVGPGTGATYCFENTATTLLVDGTTASAGIPSSSSVIAGNYMPVESFNNLIGCPANGNWTLEITDNLSSDDGYIFNWDIDFNASLTTAYSFTPTISSQTWQAAAGLSNTGLGTANLTPTLASVGTKDYIYRVTDNLGCVYYDTIAVTVNQVSTTPSIPAINTSQCPNTTHTLTASGGTVGTSSSLHWYTGANGTGSSLGNTSSITVTPTANTTYYVRREGVCNNSADASVTINLKDYVYALNATTTNTYCTDNSGWHHFFNGNEIYLSIQGDLSGAPASFPQVTINDNNSYYQQTQGPFYPSSCASGWTPGEERFEMERSWNLNFGGGTLIPPYNVRFYYQPAEKTAIENAAANHIANYSACGYTYKYATPLGLYWFKNIGSNYTAPDYDGLHLTAAAGTTPNGITYSEMTGVTSFSGGSAAIILVPINSLPVEWLSFDGRTDNKTNFLSWATEQEKNTAHFNIQRSSNALDFTNIGTVAAQGNSTTISNYTYDDITPLSGANYYRLELVDNNGDISYSSIILLNIRQNGTDYTFYPNPTENIVNYEYEASIKEPLEIEVIDIYGRTLENIQIESQTGINQIPVSLESYPVGTYIIKVYHMRSGNVHTAKVIRSDN